MNTLFDSIVKTCGVFFEHSLLKFNAIDAYHYVISGDELGLALDHYRRERREVKVLKWFADFWVYMEIAIQPLKDQYPSTFITLSIFQGDLDDNIKTQLFRAEWDNYPNDLSCHPQPHWHIYPFRYDSKTYEDFETYYLMRAEEENAKGFAAQILNKKNKIIDIRNIHFAMNAQWSDKGGYIHKISGNETIINWINGLLMHIKEQLQHVSDH